MAPSILLSNDETIPQLEKVLGLEGHQKGLGLEGRLRTESLEGEIQVTCMYCYEYIP